MPQAMKHLATILTLAVGCNAGAQTTYGTMHPTGTLPAQSGIDERVQTPPIPQQKTITCGLYMHNEHRPAHCATMNSQQEQVFGSTSCMYLQAEDKCVPDIHFVTEAEWQTLLKRLADLEYKGGRVTGANR